MILIQQKKIINFSEEIKWRKNVTYWNIKWGCFMTEINALQTFFGDFKH